MRGDLLDLSTEYKSCAQVCGSPQQRTHRIEHQETRHAHVEDAGQRRRYCSNTWKKFSEDKRAGALSRKTASGASDAGVRLQRNFAEQLQDSDALDSA